MFRHQLNWSTKKNGKIPKWNWNATLTQLHMFFCSWSLNLNIVICIFTGSANAFSYCLLELNSIRVCIFHRLCTKGNKCICLCHFCLSASHTCFLLVHRMTLNILTHSVALYVVTGYMVHCSLPTVLVVFQQPCMMLILISGKLRDLFFFHCKICADISGHSLEGCQMRIGWSKWQSSVLWQTITWESL